MQTPTAQDPNKPTIEMSLREHLLAAGAGQPTVQPLPQHSAHTQHVQHPHTTGPPHAIDPAIGGSYDMSAGGPDDGNSSEGRSKGRRELSTSKRAAQNRAAQRAFRQRKEEYIKQLKDQVKEFEQLCELYKTLQTENYQLRDYIINLQSRLLETQGEIPPAPAGSPNNSTGGLSERQIGELQMAAQAAAAAQHGTAGSKHANSDSSYDYTEKRQKVDESHQGQQPSPPFYSNANAY
ncbi:basic-leucine zipper transcription factor [Pyrenophora tritici-repentis]|nr:basic-leucine zipper transcription factor [Pyrenophora tritici-repentis]KAG9379417.1 basic-leucine zipper transcription factor [Pyrenophora tritici-repentis]KAI0570026.1 basic-leucine zipper transcription factor [Pyrenophora tritici-repentis]KAI0616659.1 basic-leucine zipper transcription factor [Pyrenophora tritici-repentis]KAI1526647.1 hypothetical protein PtrSN001C_010156 [Pyrenophora tritici-repentis]